MRVLLLLLLVAAPAAAQSALVGRVVDDATGEPLPGANVFAVRLAADSTQTGAAADLDGRFRVAVAPGTWRLRISYVGYAASVQEAVARGASLDLGEIRLAPVALGEVAVGAVRERVTLRGDTTAFNAEAFPVRPDASAEDIVARLPGVVVQDGQVQAQGETVRRVLVDGEEFFGDPATALRNLPADVVREIKVFDRPGEQARFTGFDDGQAETTINIVTRSGLPTAPVGRVYGGGGTDGRYTAGATAHRFSGASRLSVIAQANNINQQNFAAEDLAGVVSEAGGGGRGGRGGGRGGSGGGPGGGGPGGGQAGTYLVGEQGGLARTAAAGLNYSDRWGRPDGRNVRVSGSYFASRVATDADASLDRAYALADGLNYSETALREAVTTNHRFSARAEASLSERTQLVVAPRLSLQLADATGASTALSRLGTGALVGQTALDEATDRTGLSASGEIVLRHRLARPGRTVSLRLAADATTRSTDADQRLSAFGPDTTDVEQRWTDGATASRTYSAELTATEALSERLQLQVEVEPSLTTATSDQDALLADDAGVAAPDPLRTTGSEQRVAAVQTGAQVRWNGERLRASAGLDLRHEQLAFDQQGALAFDVDRATTALLPSASLRYSFSERTRVDVRYRASTRPPSVSDLRAVPDDTNPLLVTVGNPDLRTAREQRLDVRLRATAPAAGAVAFGGLQLSTASDYVARAVTVAGADTLVVDGVALAPGAQLSRAVNLDGYRRARVFGSVGRPIAPLRLNANLTGGLTHTRTPTLADGLEAFASSVTADARVFASTSASPRLDATAGYGLSWTRQTSPSVVEPEVTARHHGTAAFTWTPPGGAVVASDLTLTAYAGGLRVPTAALWNASVGYRLADRAELRLGVYDILEQGAAVRQSITETYVETVETQALGRHALLTLSYRLTPPARLAAPDGPRRR